MESFSNTKSVPLTGAFSLTCFIRSLDLKSTLDGYLVQDTDVLAKRPVSWAITREVLLNKLTAESARLGHGVLAPVPKTVICLKVKAVRKIGVLNKATLTDL